MKAYSVDLRKKIVAAHQEQKLSIRATAAIFAVSKSLVQKLVKQQKIEGNLQPKPRGKPRYSHLNNAQTELREIVVAHPDATLVELCELFAHRTGNWVGKTAMCSALQKLRLNRKKKRSGVAKQGQNSMDSKAFEVFIEKCLVPQLWSGAVVVMDNLPAHKLASIKPMIEAVGASILCLSPYSPDFNPIELWWSQLKSLLRQFSPTTTKMVDTIIAVALDLMNPKHLKNWFTNCCYCTS